MKKIFSFLLFSILTAYSASAQVTFSPAVFTAEDEVTLTVDVSGTKMEGASEAYIWIFSNVGVGGGRDGFTNTAWTASPDTAKMTAAGPNKWSYTFTGTTMFGQTPGELKNFGFLAKSKDGSKQTDNFEPFAFDPLVFIPALLRVFPSKVDVDDVVTVNYEQSLGTTVAEQRMSPATATITMLDDAGNTVGAALTIPVRKTEASAWSATFIPSRSFTPAAGRKLARFRYKFNGTTRDASGASTTVSSSEAELTFTPLK